MNSAICVLIEESLRLERFIKISDCQIKKERANKELRIIKIGIDAMLNAEEEDNN